MAANSQFAVATHILTAIAHKESKGAAPSDEATACSAYLAESVNTNAVVVRRIVSELAKAGLVVAKKGKGGGISLARPAEKITLLDIFEAMGGPPIFAFNPNKPNPKCPISVRMIRVLEPVFEDVQDGMREGLARTRLSDLVKKLE